MMKGYYNNVYMGINMTSFTSVLIFVAIISTLICLEVNQSFGIMSFDDNVFSNNQINNETSFSQDKNSSFTIGGFKLTPR